MVVKVETPFYQCNVCNNIIVLFNNINVPDCCGQKMEMIIPVKKPNLKINHVPVLAQINNLATVNVSGKHHVMKEEHYIKWICIITKNGSQMRYLKPTDNPYAKFFLINDEVLEIYSYCNQHGLWYKNLK